MSIQRVIIVRHGETDYNVHHRWQGHLDVPLNKVGMKQSKALAAHLQDEPIDAIFSSDLKRAMDTVRPLAKRKKLTIIPDKRLREIHLGVFQGLKRNDIHEAYPHEAMRWDQDDSYVIPNGESRVLVQNRMLAAWKHIIALPDYSSVMIASHGGSIRMLFLQLFPDLIERLHFANTSVSILEKNAQQSWEIKQRNSIEHLE